MSHAHVDSIDALKQLRTALWKFTETANQCLSEADADVQRMVNWLEQDARILWQGQIKLRTQRMNQARESLRAKLSVTRRDGTKPSAIEEQKALAAAKARLETAQQKLERVKQQAKAFQREALQYHGMMQRFVNTVQMEIPQAAAHLDALVGSLEQYAAPEEIKSSATDAGAFPGLLGTGEASMVRAVDDTKKSSHPEAGDAVEAAAKPNPHAVTGPAEASTGSSQAEGSREE